MHRSGLKARLAAYRARWPEESETVARFEDFVDSHPDCFHRSCRVGHVTGSAWIVDRTGGTRAAHPPPQARALVAARGSQRRGGGHPRGGAARGGKSESGLPVRAHDDAIFDLDVHPIPALPGEPAHYHFDVRFLVRAEHDRFRISAESHALKWVPAEGLGALTNEESVLRMAQKWLARRGGGDAAKGSGAFLRGLGSGPGSGRPSDPPSRA